VDTVRQSVPLNTIRASRVAPQGAPAPTRGAVSKMLRKNNHTGTMLHRNEVGKSNLPENTVRIQWDINRPNFQQGNTSGKGKSKALNKPISLKNWSSKTSHTQV
jgi:hypothetical protein